MQERATSTGIDACAYDTEKSYQYMYTLYGDDGEFFQLNWL